MEAKRKTVAGLLRNRSFHRHTHPIPTSQCNADKNTGGIRWTLALMEHDNVSHDQTRESRCSKAQVQLPPTPPPSPPPPQKE